jgi:hypothetical protein
MAEFVVSDDGKFQRGCMGDFVYYICNYLYSRGLFTHVEGSNTGSLMVVDFFNDYFVQYFSSSVIVLINLYSCRQVSWRLMARVVGIVIIYA